MSKGYELLATLNSDNKTYTIPSDIHDIKLAFTTPFYSGCFGFCDEMHTSSMYGGSGCMYNNGSSVAQRPDAGIAYGWNKTTRVMTYIGALQDNAASSGTLEIYGRA